MTQTDSSETQTIQATAVASEAERRTIGSEFVNALIERDFARFESLLAPTMRMRSLLAHGHEDFHGTAEVVPAFVGWFDGYARAEVIGTNVDVVGDRLAVSYHFHVWWSSSEPPVAIEQTAYMKVQGGKIVTIDLLCSGWRPAAVPDATPAVEAVPALA